MGKTKQKRERYQSGSLFEKSGQWWLRYSEQHADGRKARPIVCVGTTEQYNTYKKARIEADAKMASLQESGVVTRWGDLCDGYFQNATGHLRSHSLQNRKCIVKLLKNAMYNGGKIDKGKIGPMRPFADERIDHLASAAGRVKLEDWLNGQKMSANHRHTVKAVMRLIFRYGMKQDLIKGENPVDLIDTHNMRHNTNPKRRRDLITPEQYELLQNDPELPLLCKVVLAVMEFTGMRGCEALALSWEHGRPGDPDYRGCDIDFDSKPAKIWVRRSVKEGKHIDEPKTPDSLRTVALTAKLAEILRHWRSAEPIFNNWVFGSPHTNNPYTGSVVRKYIKGAAARHGFDYHGFGLHNNRHTFKRALEKTGATMQQQMRALGHTNPRTLTGYGNGGADNAEELAPFAEKVVSILEGKGSPFESATYVPPTRVN
jgi:integrase